MGNIESDMLYTTNKDIDGHVEDENGVITRKPVKFMRLKDFMPSMSVLLSGGAKIDHKVRTCSTTHLLQLPIKRCKC